MNILVVYHRPVVPTIGGASRLVMDTWEALAEKNHKVLIISVLRKPTVWKETIGNLTYIELRENPFITLVLTPTRLASHATKEKILFLHVMALSKSYRLISKTLVKTLRKICFEPHIIVAEQPYVFQLTYVISKMLNVPVVLREHNFEAEYLERTSPKGLSRYVANAFLRFVEQEAIFKSVRTLTVSVRDSLLLRSLLPSSERNKVSYIDPLIIKRGKNLGEGYVREAGLEPHNYILFVASNHKFNFHSLKALLNASKSIRNVTIAIAGKVCDYISQPRKLPPNVKVLGVVSNDALNTLYSYALVAYAPLPHGTGVPIKLVEAIIHGVPSITTPNALLTLKGLKHGENVYAIPLNALQNVLPKILSNEVIDRLREGVKGLTLRLSRNELAGKYENMLIETANVWNTS